MWVETDVIGLLSLNVVSFSHNVGPGTPIFSANVVPKSRCNRVGTGMLSGRYTYRAVSEVLTELAKNLQKFVKHRRRPRPPGPKPHKSHAYKPAV